MICASSAYLPALARRLQGAITSVSDWALKHGFVFSAEKTVALHIHPGRVREGNPHLSIMGQPIEFAPSARFLGLTIDDRLSWKPHITALKANCNRKLNVLKCVSGKTWGADRKALLLIYRALIRCKMDYGCVIYQAANQTTLSKLDPVHNAALRICTGAFRTSPIASLHAESGEPSLLYRRALLSFQYIVRVKQLPHSPTWTSVFGDREYAQNEPLFLPSSTNISELAYEIEMPQLSVLSVKLDREPTWRVPAASVCSCAHYPKKDSETSEVLRTLFLEHLEREHGNSTHIYTDGSKMDEGTGCAAVCGETITARKLMAATSIFSAELYAVRDALIMAERLPYDNFTILCDSLSVLDSLRDYDTGHPIISDCLRLLLRLWESGRVTVCWVPGHVGVSGNERVDGEARRAAASDTPPWNTSLPYRDYYPIIKKVMRDEWQRQWSAVQENKLRSIKNNITTWASSYRRNRKEEVLLCRLRIGHTRLTHAHLIKREHAPFCDDCLVPLTVEHLLAECPSSSETRRRIYPRVQNRDPPTILSYMLSDHQTNNFCMASLMAYLRDTELDKLL